MRSRTLIGALIGEEAECKSSWWLPARQELHLMAYLQARWQISVMSAPEKPLVKRTSRSMSTPSSTGDFRRAALKMDLQPSAAVETWGCARDLWLCLCMPQCTGALHGVALKMDLQPSAAAENETQRCLREDETWWCACDLNSECPSAQAPSGKQLGGWSCSLRCTQPAVVWWVQELECVCCLDQAAGAKPLEAASPAAAEPGGLQASSAFWIKGLVPMAQQDSQGSSQPSMAWQGVSAQHPHPGYLYQSQQQAGRWRPAAWQVGWQPSSV